MKIFVHALFILSLNYFVHQCSAQTNWPQQTSLSGLQGMFSSNSSAFISPTIKTNFALSACGGATRSLDTNAAPETAPQATSGLMNNDVWIGFRSLSTTVKVRVCDPNFNAVVEVYRLSDGLFVTSFNVGGDNEREFGLVTNIEINEYYAARVGRYSGSGGGTFTFNVEYFSVSLSPGYSPSPPSESCYKRTNLLQRTIPITNPYGAIIQTRWRFVALNTTQADITCGSGTHNLSLNTCFEFCLDDHYATSCEARAIDSECGNVWWGYSIERPIRFCSSVCNNIVAPANNSSLVSIRSTVFNSGTTGNGTSTQWKFVADNGETELCSVWNTSYAFLPSSIQTFSNCLEANKFYDVYLRIAYCTEGRDTLPWCGPITVFSNPLPRVGILSPNCCTWVNRNNTIVYAQNNGVNFNQYRFRFTPVANGSNPCPSNNLAPIGAAVVSNWISITSAYISLPNIQQGVIYNVQAQARMQSSTCQQCDGSYNNVPEKYVDWGPPCLLGVRAASSPVAGSPLSCGCNIGAMMAENWNEEEYSALIAQYGTIEEIIDESELPSTEENTVLGIYQVQPGVIQLDLTNMFMQGDVEVRMHDLNGRLVNADIVFNTDERQLAIISMQRNLPAGIYVISVIGSNSVITEKIFISGN